MTSAAALAKANATLLFMRPPLARWGSCPIRLRRATANAPAPQRWLAATDRCPTGVASRPAYWHSGGVPGRNFVASIRLFWAGLALAFLGSTAVAQQPAPDQSPPPAAVAPAPPPFPNFGASPATRHHGASA